ncbi:TonB-dependent receptor [Bacteroides caccae]|uniref:TonB-dependent receptor n=1 Tax=Bacteroides caccae TaxID=47678 RepID=UPI001F489570|nr:TonB-dependent receptor [Bacteroides caccae]MCE9460549.1 TonB-dependent receptor [Bacteroides caccae]
MINFMAKEDSVARKNGKYLLLFVFCFLVAALQAKSPVYGQAKTFTVSLKNVTLKEVISYVEKNSQYVFFFKPEVINQSTQISVSLKNATVKQLLDKVSEQANIVYEMKERQIVLKEKKVSEQSVSQKKRLLQGLVKDEQGNPIIGASIQLKNTGTGVITDLDGLFQIQVTDKNSVIVISYIGYVTQEISVGDRSSITVQLKEDTKSLEEVVVTAFGATQKKETMVGSIQQVRPAELKVPSSSLSTSFAGRMAGVIAIQRSGQPGADGADFWIRGKSTFGDATGVLIVLDGVEISSSDLNALDPEVIESFSILKDATATAMYGTRGANGVMIVTTKSGQDLLKPIINFRLETSMSQLTSVPEMVGGVDYMKLYNEALTTRGITTGLYDDTKIRATEQGLNPLVYPNVDWYNEMFNKNAFAQRFNFNIRGGKKAVTYFMSASVKHDAGNLKSLSKDYFSYNNNINVMRYDFVNNLSIKATNTTKISLGLNVSLRDWKGPSAGVDGIFSMSREASPVDFPIVYPARNDKEIYTLWGGMSGGIYNNGYRNPVAEYVVGYKKQFASTVNANIRLDQDLKMVTKGLKLHVLASFKNWSKTETTRKAGYNQFEIDQYNEATGEYTLSRVGNEQKTALNTEGAATGDRRIFIQAYLDYKRKFGVHDVNAMLLYNQDQLDNNKPDNLLSSLPRRKQGIAARLSYAYDDRYLAEVNFGYNGSENFAKNNRFGFFPSIALGYNISQEKFWEPISNVISHFKLRGSYGLVGNDGINERYAYLEDIVLSSDKWKYTMGVNQNVNLQGPVWNRYYNPNLTWEVGKKLNVGFDMQLFHQVNLNFDVFKEIRSKIYMQKVNTLPDFIGTGETKIYENSGKMKNVGFDIALDYNKQITKDFFLSFKGTLTYAHNTILERDEPPFQLYPNLSSVGYSRGQHLVYVADGLFRDQADVDSHAEQTLGYIPQPGDIKYVDQPDANGNCDGIINTNDRVYMGYPEDPEIVYGFGPSMKYKNWDFSFFFQGAARTSILMSGFHPFGKNATRGVMKFIADDYWSESNPNPNAAYPRLTRDTNANNTVNSSYWLRNGAFLKLKNAEIGYTFKMFRAYLNGSNLLTFSPFKHWDPEMGGGSGMKYPTQRVFNIGIQFTFK